MTVVRGAGLEFARLPGRLSADPLEGAGAESSLRVVKLARTLGRTAHRHPLTEEVVYVAWGRGTVWIDGATERVGPGDVVRVPRGAAHATVPDEGEEMLLVCFFPHPDLAANSQETDIQVTAEEEMT